MDLFTKRSIITLFFLFAVSVGFSQDITGAWEGNYGRTLLSTQPQKLVVEINIHNDSIISGLSHLYYKNNKYEHYYINGIFHKADSTIFFREDSTIAVKLGLFVSNCLGTYKTKLSVSETAMRQEGRWKDREFLGCPATSVWLEKKLYKPKKDTVALTGVVAAPVQPVIPVKILERETDIQKLVEVALSDKDSIKIELYDNGEIDGDSVSLYVENKEVVTRQRITTNPIVFYLSLDKNNPLTKLRLVAESIGSIPPCTAVMIITSKHSRQEISLSSNFSKNATVEFFLKE